MIVLAGLSDLKQLPGEMVLLSPSQRGEGMQLIAESTKPAYLSLPFVRESFSWYAKHISKREAWDKHFEFATEARFYLYRVGGRTR
jgi:hypothetical protein